MPVVDTNQQNCRRWDQSAEPTFSLSRLQLKPQGQDSGTATIAIQDAWQAVSGQIAEIEIDPDEDVKPSQFAKTFSEEIISRISIPKSQLLPVRVVVTDSGGLRITWASLDREVRFVCGQSPQNKSYIYIQKTLYSSSLLGAEAGLLQKALIWLNG